MREEKTTPEINTLESLINPGPRPALGYIPSLDGLRAIAVILVMLTHANFQLGENGILGVDIFFALSGFLITTILLEEHNKRSSISLKAFYLRRTFRLVPALFIVLTVILLYAIFIPTGAKQKAIMGEILASGLYLNNIAWTWGWGDQNLLLGHTWSLAVEEQFYLIWPCFLIVALRYQRLMWLNIMLAGFITLCLVVKTTGTLSGIGHSLLHESIFIGCLAAILRWRSKTVFHIPEVVTFSLLALIVIAGVLPLTTYVQLYEHGGRSLVALISAIVIFGLLCSPSGFTGRLLSIPVLVGIGKISYALYLWHVPVFRWFKWHSTLPPYQSFILKFIITFLLAGLSWILVEKRATQFGRKLSRKLTKRSLKSISMKEAV